MNDNKVNCQHACKNTCEALSKSFEIENNILELYTNVIDDCTLPEVKSFLSDLIVEKKNVIQKLRMRINEMQEKSHIIDDIAESYNKEVE